MTIRPMMPVHQTLFCMQQNALKYTISQFLWHGRTCSEVNGFAAVTQLTTTTKNKQTTSTTNIINHHHTP